jgi:adenine specific DNA methylase Mod
MAQQLIWGDKKYVLPSLLAEFAGKVNLIYIDPPFDTGADFSFTARIPENPETEDQPFTFRKNRASSNRRLIVIPGGAGSNHIFSGFLKR